MRIGVVIVTYNRIKLLKECIERVLKQTQPIDAVIVVNNNSGDGTKEYLDGLEDSRVHAYHEGVNLGGAGGFHKALSIASKDNFDYVLIIDDDAMLEHNYMKKIVDFADRNRQYNAYAGAVYSEGVIDVSHRRRISSKLIFWEKNLPASEYDRARVVDTATFCGLVIRGKELKRIGLPLDEYFIWLDDTEFCLRIDKHVVLVPTAKINHKTILSYNAGRFFERYNWKYYYGLRNRYDCAKRHLGVFTCFMILAEYFVFYLVSLAMMFDKDKRSQAKFNLKMLKQVIIDCIKGNLGKNDDYLP